MAKRKSSKQGHKIVQEGSCREEEEGIRLSWESIASILDLRQKNKSRKRGKASPDREKTKGKFAANRVNSNVKEGQGRSSSRNYKQCLLISPAPVSLSMTKTRLLDYLSCNSTYRPKLPGFPVQIIDTQNQHLLIIDEVTNIRLGRQHRKFCKEMSKWFPHWVNLKQKS